MADIIHIVGQLTSLRYKHEITGETSNKTVSECRGGLLMDEMGMGKSLSVLALIVHTLEQANTFEVFSQNTGLGRKRIRSTLIITPATSKGWPYRRIFR